MAAFAALMRILSGRRRGGEQRAPAAGFLGRIARSEAGNVMAMMAIGIFPLAGLVGGALDMSRIYLVKMRLQQACDAGSLAGRRIMGAGQWSANNDAADNAARQFFDNNFATNAYGTANLTRTFTEAAGRVTGTASATVPMTLMRIFGSEQQVVAVTCDAEMRLPNTDVMFVLDTTGSMAQTLPGDTSTKITTLRFAVKCFYETVARLDTNADCTPGTEGPTGGTGTQTQIRFGFVPYATNVNVGRLLHHDWLANSWQYQTRVPRTTTVQAWSLGSTSSITWGNYNNPSVPNPSSFTNVGADVGTFPATRTSATENNCASQPAPASTDVAGTATHSAATPPTYPASELTGSFTEALPYTRTAYRYDWNRQGGGSRACHLQRGTSTYNKTRTGSGTAPIIWTAYQRFDGWRYQQASLNTSGLKAGPSAPSPWNDTVALPLSTTTVSNIRLSGSSSATTLTIPANVDVAWDGCIEERATVRTTNFSPIPNDAYDLNINLVPSSGTATSLWGPALPGAVYARGVRPGDDDDEGNPTTATVDDSGDFRRADQGGYFCAPEARRLQAWPTAGSLDTYVDLLTPNGNTYHDIGLVWGARLMSPTGIFASDNALTPGGGEIERHMIFMTDGETCTSEWNYAAYGLPWYDRRQTSSSSAPSGGCGDSGTLTQQVNLRFSALCNAVRNQNITLWVVYFGSTDTNTLNRMTACATPGRFFYANNSAGLVSSFRTIADQISQLRLTR